MVLMSLTTAVDQLSMWSQYGDRAEGVFGILESSVIFQKLIFLGYRMHEFVALRSSESKIEELEDSAECCRNQESKRFIYRIDI